MRILLQLLIVPAALVAVDVRAQTPEALPPYEPSPALFGEIRLWGNEMNVMTLWKEGFHKHQIGLNFWANTVAGTAAGVGALCAGVADIGFMGREAVPLELQSFQHFFGYAPLEIDVATGTFDGDQTPGTVIFVNKKNPISQLTVKQLDGIFGAQRSGGWKGTEWSTEPARGPEGNLRTWGQLGLTGEWADKPIHVYGYDLTVNGFAFAFQRNVFKGGDSWNPDLHEFPISEPGRKGAVPKSGARAMMKALADDPYGIALGAVKYGREQPDIKPLALAAKEGGDYILPSKESYTNWTYPLLEPICLYLNRVPGQPVDPKVKEFLRYILSSEGQEAVVKDGEYLPLTAERLNEQLRKLE